MPEQKKPKPKLIPPDKKRCQALRPNGNNFMTFGGVVGMERCKEVPTVIITELNRSEIDGLIGSMSLCDHCLGKAKEQLGEAYFIVKEIKRKKK